MKKFLSLLLCLLLGSFTAVHAARPARVGLRGSYTQPSSGQVAFDDDDSTEIPSGAEGEDVNDDGSGDALGDQTTGENGAGDNDESDGAGGDEGQ